MTQSEPQPAGAYRASELVGINVRKWRLRRGWSQRRLVDRLDELLTESPSWTEDLYRAREDDPSRPKDPRERKPGVPKAGSSWNQSKIARLEGGKAQKVRVEDVFELALALDVSPLQLMAAGEDERGVQLRMYLGPAFVEWPERVREWIRGAKPLLGPGAYHTDAEWKAARRFYLLESQPPSEWSRIKEAGEYAKEVEKSLGLLIPEDTGARRLVERLGGRVVS